MQTSRIQVVGSGLVGALTALYLGKAGYEVDLYERRPDMRRADIAAGRSINLVITDRGLQAVDRVGLKERILDITIPMKGRMLHDVSGETTFVPYGQTDKEVINSVSRGELNCLLMDAVEELSNVTIHFEHKCQSYDIESKTITFTNGKTSEFSKNMRYRNFSLLTRNIDLVNNLIDHILIIVIKLKRVFNRETAANI